MTNCPLLTDTATGQQYPLPGEGPHLVGRTAEAAVAVTDPDCSRRHCAVVCDGGCYFVEPLAEGNPTLVDGTAVRGRTVLRDGARVRVGKTELEFRAGVGTNGQVSASGRVRRVPPPPPVVVKRERAAAPEAAGKTVLGQVSQLAAAGLPEEIAIRGVTTVGRDPGNTIPLNHPTVSRRHATFALSSGHIVVGDQTSANGTFVNGRRLGRARVRLADGDVIDIGPYGFEYAGGRLRPRSRSDNVELSCRDVRRVVTERGTGRPLVLLDGITLTVRPKEFVCLLGPSGSGKSTLMAVMSGRAGPNEGRVLLNGRDLHAHFEGLKQDIALVPQRDILHETLTVGRALGYTARLRLPPDTSRRDVNRAVNDTLDAVQLGGRRGTAIRHLSGGQVKRASLANEIICKPSLLFLDEVTSGLDEQTDGEMMHLFRRIADGGKTVVCVTHSLAHVERTCHLVVVLTEGGRLAFVGRPAEALAYFRIERLGDVYARLGERPAEQWQAEFRGSQQFKTYVAGRAPAPAGGAKQAGRARPGPIATARLFARQSVLLTERYAAVWFGDRTALTLLLVQSVLVAALLAVVFGEVKPAERPNLLFLLAVSSFWFGCNNAAKELVKERPIFTRERDFNLLLGGYYVSKLVLLTLFAAVQVLVLFGAVAAWCGLRDDPGRHLAVLLSLAGCGTALGLAISAAANTEEVAITLIPVAVIPQIILSGAVAPLSGASMGIAEAAISVYWGNEALVTIPRGGSRYGQALAMIGLHALAFVSAAVVILWWRGRRRAVGS